MCSIVYTPVYVYLCVSSAYLYMQGILNWKYKAEEALRASGLPYTIIRATGIVPYSVCNDTRKLEFEQVKA